MSFSFSLFLQKYPHLTIFSTKELADITQNNNKLFKLLDAAAELEFKILAKERGTVFRPKNLPELIIWIDNSLLDDDLIIGNFSLKKSEKMYILYEYITLDYKHQKIFDEEILPYINDYEKIGIIKIDIITTLGYEKNIIKTIYFRRIIEYKKFLKILRKNKQIKTR